MASQLVQRIINSNHDGRFFLAGVLGVIERQLFLSATALLA
jgi:hypothetical protein